MEQKGHVGVTLAKVETPDPEHQARAAGRVAALLQAGLSLFFTTPPPSPAPPPWPGITSSHRAQGQQQGEGKGKKPLEDQ